MCYSQVINYYSHHNVQLYFFYKEQEINAQNSINNGPRTEGGLPVEGVKQISFAHLVPVTTYFFPYFLLRINRS